MKKESYEVLYTISFAREIQGLKLLAKTFFGDYFFSPRKLKVIIH